MTMRQDFEACGGAYGLICRFPGEQTTDNGALFTTEYYLILKRMNFLLSSDLDNYKQIMEDCMQSDGMSQRKPGDNSQDSPDNMIALAVGSKAFGTNFAQRMLAYGRTTFPKYVYNQPNPGKFTWSAWMGRMPGLIGFMKICAGEKANPLELLCLYAGVIITMLQPHSNTSDKLLTQIMLEQMPDSLIKRLWNKYIKNAYGGINGVCQIYFPTNSPFRAYWT